MTTRRLDPIHPGEILEEEFMRPLGLSANALAKAMDVPVTRVSEIVRGRRGVTADTALRLGRLLGTTAELWLALQSEYDLRVARRDLDVAIRARVVPLKAERAAAALEVHEPKAAYGARASRRDHDRRRRRMAGRAGAQIALERLTRKDDSIISSAELKKGIGRRKS
jgi:addiction module HigA family antidote